MALGEILQARWVSPLRAIEIVGKASFEDWTGWQTSSPDHRKIAIKNLKLALASGAVQSYHVDASGFELAFDPISFDGSRVRIDIENDGCKIQPGPIEEMRIDVDALSLFFLSISKSVPPTTAKSETNCARWLEGKLSDRAMCSTKSVLFAEAKKEFSPLSGRSFDRAYQLAIGRTGRHELSKGGRPRKNQTTAPKKP